MPILSCPVCSYPVEVQSEGQTAVCAYCNETLISQEGITIPTGFFWGCVAFVAGMFLGPALVASSERGREWLQRQAKGG